MWQLVVLSQILIFAASFGTEISICNNPNEWCSSDETANLCGVAEYCKSKEKGSNVDHTLNVTLYMESLCPDCRRFILFQLYPTFQKLYPTGIFRLRLVPYGNAREYKVKNRWVFNCQHGPHECYGNLIETCAIHYLKDMKIIMPFVYCMELEGPDSIHAEKCAEKQKIDYSPIQECVKSGEGNALEHEMAVETDKLNPPHTYVPWVTINGEHTEKMQQKLQDNMGAYLCSIYQGVKPKACNDF